MSSPACSGFALGGGEEMTACALELAKRAVYSGRGLRGETVVSLEC
jgi:hypothetical protein